jgi:Protein of unknown function (DUF2934)
MVTAHTSNEPGKGRRVSQQPKSKPTPTRKKSSPVAQAKPVAPKVTRSHFNDDEWYDMVATAAYYRAQSRGFEGGSPELDWYEAEAELEEQLACD